MKIIIYILILLLNFNLSLSQTPISYLKSTINSSTGLTQLCDKFDSYSFENNNLSFFSLNIMPNNYGLSELNILEFNSLFKLEQNSLVGFRIKGNSSEVYKEFAFSSNFTYLVNDFVVLGFNLNYNLVNIKNYNKQSQYNLDVFGKLKFDKNFFAGFKIENLNKDKYIETSSPYQRLQIGFAYNFNDLIQSEFTTAIHLNKHSGYIFSNKIIANENIKFKIAIDFAYSEFEIASKYESKEFDILVSTLYNNVLGYKPNLEFKYKW